jgi:hypothetical protein
VFDVPYRLSVKSRDTPGYLDHLLRHESLTVEKKC